METIDDIVKEILKEVRESEINNPDKTTRIFLTSANMALKDFAARLKNAYKSLEAEKSRIIAELNEVRELNRRYCDENERLMCALQPVIEIVMDEQTSDLSMELAIKEAQSIWRKVKNQ